MPIEIIESHSILPDLVRGGGVIVDCGANVGAFSMEMIRRFGCRCYAFEASPSVFGRMVIHSNIVSRNLAICGSDRLVSLTPSEDITRAKIDNTLVALSSSTMVQGRHLGMLLAEFGILDIDVLKLDIEGAELEVIDSLSDEFFRNVGQMTVEFHDFLGYTTAQEVSKRIDRLTNIGFRELYWSRRRNTGDVLLVNSRRLGPVRHAFEQEVVRRLRAVGRVWSRLRLMKS
jgi:FkbM family methyltransferase